MCRNGQRITPFVKQCFAVSSIILNMVSYGLTTGYNATLFSELRKTKEIVLDMDSESWLASLVGVTFFFGSVISSLVMETYGRKPAILLSSVCMISGWISFSLASTFPVLLLAKLLHGLSVGLGTNVGGILIGEYSSPRYRGSFIAIIPTALLFGTMVAHAFGIYFGWHELCKILVFLSLPGLIVAVFAPESPSFLVKKGRYDECKKNFRWLRGCREEKELDAMIRTDIIVKESHKNQNPSLTTIVKKKVAYIIIAFKKREFRIPIVIMMHLSAMNQFCGAIVQDIYALDVHTALYGTDIYMFKVITSLDVMRLLSTIAAIYVTSRLRRRLMLQVFVTLNICVIFSIAGYIYAKQHGLLPFENIAFVLILHHLLYFIIGVGSMPLSVIIGGEVFPLADRGLCLIITRIFCSLYMFGNIKSAPYLFSALGVDGAFCLYGFILVYCLIVSCILLPETKDKTLQEVEEEFRGKITDGDEEAINLNDVKESR